MSSIKMALSPADKLVGKGYTSTLQALFLGRWPLLFPTFPILVFSGVTRVFVSHMLLYREQFREEQFEFVSRDSAWRCLMSLMALVAAAAFSLACMLKHVPLAWKVIPRYLYSLTIRKLAVLCVMVSFFGTLPLFLKTIITVFFSFISIPFISAHLARWLNLSCSSAGFFAARVMSSAYMYSVPFSPSLHIAVTTSAIIKLKRCGLMGSP
ncbi:hypothetical protein C0J52_24472 [Blattella germanica]|nr:hypothetical protein C0J52_24472 [Blattella germanica]